MPTYVLTCEACERPRLGEFVGRYADRQRIRCAQCGGVLVEDYSRHKTAGFSLRGDNWPGKMNQIEQAMLKSGE